MTLRNRIKLYQQLAAFARAGVPLRGALTRLLERMPLPEVRALSQQVDAGNPLADGFVAARFSPFECHLVAAGERSAQLQTIFERLAEFWNRELRFTQAVKQQLVYPVVVLHLAVVVLALTQFFHGMTAVISTLILGFVALYFTGFVLYTLARASWNSEATRALWLRVPLVGSSLSTAYAFRWITALRMEFSAGVSLPDAVSDAWLASGYLDSAARAEEGERGLRSGEQLSQLVNRWRQLPRDWVDYVETGEVSGEFDAMFTNIEKEAEHNWTVAQQRMAEWVPKILYFVVLLFVAALIIYEYNQVVLAPIKEVENSINQ